MQSSSSVDSSFAAELKSYEGRRYGTVYAWDAVNEPMIRQWCEAIEFESAAHLGASAAANTVHRELVAPGTMLPVWLMPGIRNQRPEGSDLSNNREVMGFLESHGYVGILGTNAEQEYERYLRLGERVSCTYTTESISDEKQTRFGPGFFITFLQEFKDESNQLVGTLRLRILRFKPKVNTADNEATPIRPSPPQPTLSQDTAFFWEGLQAGKLLIQRCTACKTLRHPPGPACVRCHCLQWDAVEASGHGKLASFVVMHKPQVPGFNYPHPVGLVELDEGVRLVAPLTGASPDEFEIGMRVEAVIEPVQGEYRLPKFQLLKNG